MQLAQLINNLFFKQYELRLFNYSFCNVSQKILITLKPRFSRYKVEISINEILSNMNFLSKIHPYDSYIIGILNRLVQENYNPLQHETLIKIQHNNEKIKHRIRFLGINYIEASLQFNIGKHLTHHNISIEKFLKNSYIVRVLNSHDAVKLGYTITDFLLDKIPYELQ